MLSPGWTFTEMIPVVVVAALLLFLPGAVFLYLLSRRVVLSVAVAPLVTVGLVALGGVVISSLSLPWGIGALVVLTLLLWAAAVAVLLLERRRGAGPSRTDWGIPIRILPALAGVAIAFLLTTWWYLRGAGAPGNFPQAPDMVFHYGVIRRFVEAADICSLTANGINAPDTAGFYPAAFHGLAATLMILSGAPVAVATSALILVVIGLVWPLGVVVFLRSALRVNQWTASVAAVLAGLSLSFPVRPLVHGPVWPMLFGFALILPALTLLVLAVRVQTGRLRVNLVATGGFLLAVPTLFLAHSSALFGVALIGWCFLLSVAFTLGRRSGPRSTGRRVGFGAFVALLVLGILGVALTAWVAPPGMRELIGPIREPMWVVRRILLGWPSDTDRGIIVALGFQLLVLLGVVRGLRSSQHCWLSIGYLLVVLVDLVVETQRPSWGWVLSWPWYNLDFRVQALAVVLAVPLAGLGLQTVASRATWPPRSPALLRRGTTAAAVLGLAVMAVPLSVDYLQWRYNPDPAKAWLTDAEAAALLELSALLPDDAVVAANPWNGATFLAVVGPEEVVIPTEKARGADIDLLSTSLDRLEESPEVCAVVERHDVGYAITGGDPYSGHEHEAVAYQGIDRVADDPDFRLIAQSGPYRLYEVPACSA